MRRRFGRGLAGLVEASWSGAPRTVAWTRALGPIASGYGAASADVRRRAAATRRPVPGVRVTAIGNLTVGGTGKSSLARWIAARAGERERTAILLRGFGGARAGTRPHAVPDFPGYPLARAAAAYGDEAAAHRAALPRTAAIIVGRDRWAAALMARDGYGAASVTLDDGWEQGRLQWDALWVALDPAHPKGNGAGIPAGPLRRPPETLAEASVLAFVLEHEGEDVGLEARALAARFAPAAPVVRFRRVLLGAAIPCGGGPAESLPTGGPALLLTAVGSPERVERFARGAGIELAGHAAFPDHARVDRSRLLDLLRRAARRGATMALLTEKDEHRWSLPAESPLPIRVLRTGLLPLDPVDSLPGLDAGRARPIEPAAARAGS